MTDDADIVRVLGEDHAIVREALDHLGRLAQAPAPRKRSALARVAAVVRHHIDREEKVLYAILERIFETQEQALEGYGHHALIHQALATLESLDPASPAWGEAFEELRARVDEHLHFQEEILFDRLRLVFDPIALRALGREFRAGPAPSAWPRHCKALRA